MPIIETSNVFPLDFSYALGEPLCTGHFKSIPEDFRVVEILDREFSDEGEHFYLYIEKEGENTHWVQKKLAEFAGVKSSDVGVAGLKDRQAITRQWFSVYLPKPPKIDWNSFASSSWTVLDVKQHSKKLRRGDHFGNDFKIILKNVTFQNSDVDTLVERLEKIKHHGVPNYFGEQRFGIDAGNLTLAEDWFVLGKKIKNRNLKGMVLSAARSYIFNLVLSERIRQGNWNTVVSGDVMSQNSKGENPTGPLWGRGRNAASSDALIVEDAIKNQFEVWCDGLEHQGLSQERRNLVCVPKDLTWRFCDNQLTLEFSLLPGEYATSVMRELAYLK